jgi:hypothetical protein
MTMIQYIYLIVTPILILINVSSLKRFVFTRTKIKLDEQYYARHLLEMMLIC